MAARRDLAPEHSELAKQIAGNELVQWTFAVHEQDVVLPELISNQADNAERKNEALSLKSCGNVRQHGEGECT